jgi:hypothetical protein
VATSEWPSAESVDTPKSPPAYRRAFDCATAGTGRASIIAPTQINARDGSEWRSARAMTGSSVGCHVTPAGHGVTHGGQLRYGVSLPGGNNGHRK